jgi:ribosome recycling factor
MLKLECVEQFLFCTMIWLVSARDAPALHWWKDCMSNITGRPPPFCNLIKPFDSSTMKTIEKAILASDLGLTPNNDGKSIHLNLPPLTEERRRDLVKHMHHRLEESRIAIRNIRRDALSDMREFEKEKLISEDDLERGEEDLQKLTDKFIEEVAEQGKKKEAEIMEV